MKKKIILIVSVCIITVLVIVVCQALKDNSKNNEIKDNITTGEKVEKENIIKINKEIDGIEVKSIKITEQEKNKYMIVGEVENKTEEIKESRVLIIKCKELVEKEEIIFAVLLPELARGETNNFSTVIYQDISKAKSFEIEQEK